MAYTTINKSSLHMNTKLYTGNGGTQSITGVGFQPDWVWTKSRSGATNHYLTDAVRGATKTLRSNENQAETTQTGGLTAFGSDGFSIGSDSAINANSATFASWNWKAGTTSIPSGSSTAPTAVSINATAGFGIYAYTGTGSTGRTLAHGLNSAPKMMIVKRRHSTRDWSVYHSSLANTEHLELNNTDAKATRNLWGNTTPTSSLIYLGNDGQSNGGSDPYIMYAFSEVQGYSKFGSYTGNGNADGTFVYTGFKPAFVMWKKSNSTSEWIMVDSKRNTYNEVDKLLRANQNSAENTYGACDFLSNGWKFRDGDTDFQASGDTYIYMAFAEEPLVGTNNIPATAR